MRSGAMRALLLVTLLLGMSLGALQVAAPALALARGAPALAGVLIALLSVGGIAGALLYGGRRWTLDPSLRLVGLLWVAAAALLPLALLPSLALAGLLLAVAGLAINPALTTLSLLVDRHSAARTAEAFGWMSTAVGGGTAAGSAAAGALAQHSGLGPAFLCATGAAFAAGLVAAGAISGRRQAGNVT